MWRALRIVLVFTVLCGLIYPLAITGLAVGLFPRQASGSLVQKDGQVIGSTLIGQPFTAPGYFWPRPSATAPTPYNADNTGASGLGPTSAALQKAVQDRVAALRAAGVPANLPLPIDLLTASASGIDPDISPDAALLQVPRVAKARGLAEEAVRALVAQYVEGRELGLMGEPRVNVLELNLALDALNRQGS